MTTSAGEKNKKMSRRQWFGAVAAGIGAAMLGDAALKAAPVAASVTPSPAAGAPAGDTPRKVSRIAEGKAVGCVGCDACMPCGYGVDIPGNFEFYNSMLEAGLVPDLAAGDRSGADFRHKAVKFLRAYDRTVPDKHQSQRCIKCFHCVTSCREGVFIVNELAALTAITDDLRDWECREDSF